MSRSYHTTRRHIKEARRFDESDADGRVAKIEKLKDQLQAKRYTKRLVAYERGAKDAVPVTPPELIPILVKSHSPFVHFPASPGDLRAILAALPTGTADGLREIELGLGEKCQRSGWLGLDDQPPRDPLVGRVGCESIPGVYRPTVLGRYMPRRAKIELYGYVYDGNVPEEPHWQLYLRLHMLMTFLHEIGHHYDFANRISRGRWRADDHDKVEMYAEAAEDAWVKSVVMPYLAEAYPDAMQQLRSWMRNAIGLDVPLDLLAGQVCSTAKGGMVHVNAAIFSTDQAFETLVASTLKKADPLEARLQFACDLHFADMYDLARAVLTTILDVRPRYAKALTLWADILVHEEKYEEALRWANDALAAEPDLSDALETIADAYEGLDRWSEMLGIAQRLVSMATDRISRSCAIEYRATALIGLNDLPAAMADIDELNRGGKLFQRKAERLRKRLEAKKTQGQEGANR